jgi:rubredoxin
MTTRYHCDACGWEGAKPSPRDAMPVAQEFLAMAKEAVWGRPDLTP